MTKFGNGETTEGGRLKMADIARLAGVSTSTVSRALANSDLIPAHLREQITAIAQSHGYVVNQAARNLRLRRTHTINLVIPLGQEGCAQLISDPFFLEMIGRLADEITACEYEVLLTKVGDPKPGWLNRIIQAHRSDGIVIIGQSNQHEALNAAVEHYRPLVVWGAHLPDQRYCSVGSDNVGGARMAVEHLIRQGRRRIAFLGDPKTPETDLRHQGYLSALADAGLEASPELSTPARFTVDRAYAAARALIDSGAKFDGVFAGSDLIAITAIQAMSEAGLRTPEDVSVVGFDDLAIARHASPPLTTVRQNLDLGARRLVELLFRRIAGEDAPSVTLPPQLIVRQS